MKTKQAQTTHGMKQRNPLKRAERNRNIYEYYQKHPGTPVASIARIFGLSKTMVSQIIKREKELREANNELSKPQ